VTRRIQTLLAQTLARIIDVPFTMADATTLTERLEDARPLAQLFTAAGRATAAPQIRVVPQFEICESASREHKMGEYSDRVKADIVSDNFARKVLYLIFAVITVIAVFLLGGFAIFAAVLGLGPVLVLIVVIEIYCRIQNWRRLRVAEDADADLDKLRPKKSTEVLTVDAIHKLRSRAQQAQDAGEPWLAADLRLAIATLERLDREAALARRPAPGGLAPEPIQPI
jgi:hypothetical protein